MQHATRNTQHAAFLVGLIAPGGKLLYKTSGQLDSTELQAKLIDQLGAFYTPEALQ